jgi:hypothetical protein
MNVAPNHLPPSLAGSHDGSRERNYDCPSCGSGTGNRVVDSRFFMVGYGPRRRRCCADCGHRWTTVEVPHEGLDVVDGGRMMDTRLVRRIAKLTGQQRLAIVYLLRVFDGEDAA